MGCNFNHFDNSINHRKACSQRKPLQMKDNINPDDDGYDPSEEYFEKKGNTSDNETDVYFPQESSKPPHY